MARTNDKELLQCLAFAYFAERKYNGEESHRESWEDVFSVFVAKEDIMLDERERIERGTLITNELIRKINESTVPFNPKSIKKIHPAEKATKLRTIYGRYLRDSFEYTFVVKKFSNGLKRTRTGKPTAFTVKPKVKISYTVCESFVKHSLIPYSLSEYEFLDQDDTFTSTIKDESLKNIGRIFAVGGNFQKLSPVDMFIVKHSQKDAILNDFKKNIIDASDEDVLSNMSFGTFGKNTYRTITNKYFHERDMVGVSLKFPDTISGNRDMKIVGATMIVDNLKGCIDPYGKLLAEMMRSGADINKLIDKAITIKFNEFQIDSNLVSWKYPISFNYKDMLTADTHEPLYRTNLRFELLTWAEAGFNGWWIIDGKQTPWASGVGIGPAEKIFFRYHEYAKIIDVVVETRLAVLESMAPKKKIPEKMKAQYDLAEKELSKKAIVTNKGIKQTDKFLKMYSKVNPLSTPSLFRFKVTKKLTENMKTNLRMINPKTVGNHFQAAQLAFFLFKGGAGDMRMLKKRIFLSIFGVITKSGYKIFESGSGGKLEMKDYIVKQFEKNGKRVEAYFNAAPYIVLS